MRNPKKLRQPKVHAEAESLTIRTAQAREAMNVVLASVQDIKSWDIPFQKGGEPPGPTRAENVCLGSFPA